MSRAGADIIETNTYGANQLKLAEFGLEDKVRDINLRAVKIAREAREVVGREVFVVGSIGPTRSAMDPLMPDEIKLLEADLRASRSRRCSRAASTRSVSRRSRISARWLFAVDAVRELPTCRS